MVHKIRCAFIHAAATTAWTEASTLAAKGNDVSSFAGVAIKVREAVLRNAAGQKGPQLVGDEARQCAVFSCVGPGGQKSREMRLQHAIKGGGIRMARVVLRACSRRCAL